MQSVNRTVALDIGSRLLIALSLEHSLLEPQLGAVVANARSGLLCCLLRFSIYMIKVVVDSLILLLEELVELVFFRDLCNAIVSSLPEVVIDVQQPFG